MKKAVVFSLIICLALSPFLLAGEVEKRLKAKGLHVAELTDRDRLNLQISRLQQAIQLQWREAISGMLSEDYVETGQTIARGAVIEELKRSFSALSQIRGLSSQANPETGWSVTATQDFYIHNLKTSVEQDRATVECELGFRSAGRDYRSIKESLFFVLKDRKWLLAGSKSLFGFLKRASNAAGEAIGTPHLSCNPVLAGKDDFTSDYLLVPTTFYHYGKTAIPRFNQTESFNWFGFNCMNWPNGLVADIEICEGGPDFNHNYLFVSDPIANKIIGSDQDGWVGEFGSQGSGAGQFWGPRGMCTVIGYYYFVADRLNDRVTAYEYCNQLDQPRRYTDLDLYANFNHPRDVAAKDRNPYDLQDKTYLAVADEYNHRLALFLWFPYDLRLDRYYGEYGSGEGQFIRPSSVCFGRDPQTGWQTNDIFVTDNGNHRLVRLYAQLVTPYTIRWRGTYQFPPDVDLTSVDVDNKGLVYVVDRRNGRVYKFAPSEACPYYFKLLGIWGETGTEDGQVYYPNMLQVTHGRYIPDPQQSGDWVPLTGLGDVFISESWGDQTGVRRFVIAADIVNLSAEWVPYNESTGEGNFIWWEYDLTDCGTVTEQVLRGAEVCTTYNEGTLNWGSQVGSWPVDGHPHGAYYTVKVTAASTYDAAIVVEKSVDVYVDTLTIHDPVITQGIRCDHNDTLPFYCYDGYQCIQTGHSYTVDVQAYDPDGQPLTYQWNCVAGHFWDGSWQYKDITTSENHACYIAPPPPALKEEIYEKIRVTITNTIGGETGTSLDPGPYLYQSGTSCLGGDANDDGIVNVGDPAYITTYLYRGGPPPPDPIERADANNDCVITVGDMVYLIDYLYRLGPPPKCCWLHEWTP